MFISLKIDLFKIELSLVIGFNKNLKEIKKKEKINKFK